MSALAADTDARAEAVMIDILRRMTPVDRLRRSFSLRATVLALAAARIRESEPGISDGELRKRIATLWLGAPLASRVWSTRSESGR